MARDIVGKGDSDKDWKIVPTEHANQFAAQAPSLAENLRSSRIEGLAKMYEGLNRKAVDARNRFKSAIARADLAIFCAASFGALLLAGGALSEILDKVSDRIIPVIGVLVLLSSGWATMLLSQVKGQKLATNWEGTRAKAEAKRLAYFKAVMEGASKEPFDQLLALEYARRFLLDNQIDYFQERGAQHENAAQSSIKTSTQAVFIASSLTALAGLASIVEPKMSALAGLGVIASAYAALAVSRSALSLDRRNADRYLIAGEQLMERRLELDSFRARVAAGDYPAVQEFFEPIFVILESDHKAFLSDSEQRELAIGRMQARLDAIKTGQSATVESSTETGE